MYQIILERRQTERDEEANRKEVLSKSASTGCETCVMGVDVSQYDWYELEYVEVKDGKLVSF